MRILSFMTAVALLLAAPVAVAQQDRAVTPSPPAIGQPSADQPAPDALSEGDREFLTAALNTAAFGLESGRMAVARTDDEETRLLAEKLIGDFTSLGEALADMAVDAGMAAPGDLDAGRAAALAQLRLAPDGEFTPLWLTQQVEAHAEAVTLFQRAATPEPGRSQVVAELALSSLPVLRENRAALTSAAAGAGVAQVR